MRVLQLNNYHYLRGGSERYYFEVSNILKLYGNDVAFFSVFDPANSPTPFEKYFADSISFDASQTFSKKLHTAFKMLYAFENKIRIEKLINDVPCDIAHCHNIYHRVHPAVLRSLKKSGVPVVLTLHDYKMICPTYTLLRQETICEECITGSKMSVVKHRCTKSSLLWSTFHLIESFFHEVMSLYSANVNYFICPSQFLLNKHLQGGLPAERLVCIPNFINVSDYTPRYENDGYVLFVGRLSREKGVASLLQAMKGLNIPLKIVGDGPLKSELIELAAGNDITNLTFEGYRSGFELEELFRNAAFVIFPSEWYENAPMTILEAYGYGKPVIGSDIGGIPEMIVDGETGLLFPPGDSDSLREKIESLWSKPDVICRMGKAARERAEKRYSAPLHYERLMEVYQKALA